MAFPEEFQRETQMAFPEEPQTDVEGLNKSGRSQDFMYEIKKF